MTSIREHLVKGRRVFLVSGAARMGKSSLVRQIPHHLPDEYLAVRVDLLEESANQLDWLLWRVADAIGQGVGRQLDVEGLAPAWEAFEAKTGRLIDEFWPRVRLALGDRCLVLLLDDVHVLLEDGSDLLDRFMAVLGTWRDRDAGLALLLTTTLSTQEFLVREHAYLLAGSLTYTLGPLASEEATRLITWPVDGVLTYDYGVARRMIEMTSGQPYYLQLLCFEIFNRCAPAGWVNQRDVDLVIEDLVSREIADFRQVWDASSPPEQAVLAALVSLRGARGVATVQEVRTILNKAGARVERGQVSAALDRLADRGILERLGALSYRFRVTLLREWLGKRLDLQNVVRNIRWDSSSRQRHAAEEDVALLKPGRRARSLPAAGEESAAGQDAAVGRRRPWLWIAGVAVIGALLLALLGPRLFGPAPTAPAPTATMPPAATIHLATETLTPAPLTTEIPLPSPLPSDTPRPQPSLTPSPTPPLVVARPVPAIAYQSRAPGGSQWSIYVMDSDGSNRTLLAPGQAGFLAAPAWSPDGSRIAFVSDEGGDPDIWVMDIDGENRVNLTQNEAKDHSPAWSPDGDWIAFASLRDSLYWELYLMRADGSDVQRLTWWDDASDLSPSWSPDGTRLAFATKRDGNWEIYTMDRDGSNLMRLTDDPADDTNPAWSPDGGRIAFESTREGYAEIYVVPVGGGQPTNLSNAPFSSEHGPTWSPDGGRLAFYSDQDGEWDVYVMASDGSDVVKLTGDNSNDQVPAWRP